MNEAPQNGQAPTQEASAPESSGQANWVNPDGTFAVDKAPDGVREVLSNKKFNGVDDLVKSYTNLEKLKGVPEDRLLTIPQDDNPDSWNPVWNKLGRPESPDQYELGVEADLDEDLVGQFKQYAHGLGLTNKQFNDLIKFQTDSTQGYMEELERQSQSERDEKAKEYRSKFKTDDEFKDWQGGALKVAEDLGIKGTLEKKGLGDDFEIIDMLSQIKQKVSEDVIPTEGASHNPSRQDQLREIEKDEAFLDRLHPRHKEVMEKFYTLHGVRR